MLTFFKKKFKYLILLILFSFEVYSDGYNNFGHVGLINLPSAAIKEDQSIYFTFSKGPYSKVGALTVTPFKWMEASFFYHRPSDTLWGGQKGLYLDKGFNVKFLYSPKNRYLPNFAIGLDDFAGTGQLSKEYIVATYDFNNLKVTSGLGWGKFVGDTDLNTRNPLYLISGEFENRLPSSNQNLGGSPTYDTWFRGDVTLLGGLEYKIPKIKGISFKIETDPFNYLDFMCCGEGKSLESVRLRSKDSNINYGLTYQYKDIGNINFSYIKGNTWNISFSFGFSSNRSVKKEKFEPKIVNNNYGLDKKNEFYRDLLDNLNSNKLYLQTANLEKKKVNLSIDSEQHINPIRYTKEAAYITNEVSKINNVEIDEISVSNIIRGIQINEIIYQRKDLDNHYKPITLIKRDSKIRNPYNEYNFHEFRPIAVFPNINNEFSPDIRTHVGSPERVVFAGYGIKAVTEIQFNRNLTLYSSINHSIEDNFDQKVSRPTSVLEHVRTEIVDYLQATSNTTYISKLNLERIWSPASDVYAKLSFGLLESMYGGFASEILYKPHGGRFALSYELNAIKQRSYEQRFEFKKYKTNTSHINLAFYDPKSNILIKWSYGKYLS